MSTLSQDLDFYDPSAVDPLMQSSRRSASVFSSLSKSETLEEKEEEDRLVDEEENARKGLENYKVSSRGRKSQKIVLQDLPATSPVDLWSEKESSSTRTLQSWDLPGGPIAWDDDDKPFERLLNYANLSLTEEEENGFLTDRIVAACSSYLTESPGSKCHVVVKVCLTNKNLNDIRILGYHRFLQYVDLSWNNLIDLTPLGCIPYLMYLDVSHNLLEEVLRFRPPTNLTYVDYSHNQVWQIDDLSDFWALSYLDLSHNKISKIQGLHELRYLRHLDLSYNQIERAENLNNLRLTDLNLEYNLISRFEMDEGTGINTMLHLTNLYLNNNLITSLEFLKGVYQLKKLELQGNNISDLLELIHMEPLKDLRELDMRGNPVSEKKPYRNLVLNHVRELRSLDGTAVSISEKVSASKRKRFEMQLQAARNSARMILLEQLNDPTLDLEVFPADQAPYPFVILVGPSASYKKSIVAKLGDEYPEKIHVGKCHTTRQILNWEKKVLIQTTREEFNESVKAGKFLCVSEVLGQLYGFSREELRAAVKEHKMCLTSMDMVAALTIHGYGIRPFMVLALPESQESHENNLNKTYGPVLWALGAARIAHRQFSDARIHDVPTPSSALPVLQDNVRRIEIILNDVLDEVMHTTTEGTSIKIHQPRTPVTERPDTDGQDVSEYNLSWPMFGSPTRTADSESLEIVYYSTAKGCFTCTPSKCGLQASRLNPEDVTVSAKSERFSASDMDLRPETTTTSFSASQPPPLKVELSSYEESSYGEDDPFANWSLPFIDWSEVNVDGRELERRSEALCKKFIENVMSTRDIYENLHLENPGLFSLTVFTDDQQNALTKISKFLREVWRSAPTRPSVFDVRKDLVYQAFVPRKLENLKEMLRKDFLKGDTQSNFVEDPHRTNSPTTLCFEMHAKGYGDSVENL